MARGWESKAVESQQDEHARDRKRPAAASTPEQREWAARRRTLELQRSKAQADLARATNPDHRTMLERALDDIDRQLRDLAGI